MSISKTRYLLPQELLENFYSIYSSSKVDDMLRTFDSKRKTTLRVNTLKETEKSISRIFTENQIKFSKVSWYKEAYIIKNVSEKELSELDCYANGEIYLQNLSSMIPPLCMEVKCGMNILDVCSAPGSKTTQIASILENDGYILANEINVVRAERLKYNIEKLGAKCVETRIGNGKELGDKFEESFDRVMLDAPCSGEGIIDMNKPATYKRWNISNVYKNASLQRELLESGRKALKRGGIMIYSTCTISAEENEEVIDGFLKKYSDMKIENIDLLINSCVKGITEYKGKKFKSDLSKALRIIPNEIMEGFFVCKLKKV